MDFLSYFLYAIGLFCIIMTIIYSVCLYELIKQGEEAKKYREELKNYRKIERLRRKR